MKPIIEIRNISKKFRIQHEIIHYLTLRDALQNFFLLKKKNRSEIFWALNDISFNIAAGESMAIIGKNGAGKSTLLKILSKITPPTSGSIISRGRISSLLEVGTGFHAELTGRENIFLNGSIIGMKKKEILKKFDEIVNFAEVEQFIDTPLKHYSSGMQLRLAFSVAAYLEPEILIIDEVLAVGDVVFQKKCMGKMNEVSKGGRTIIFVSHNMAAVRQLCTRTVFLDHGRVLMDGDSETVIDHYLQQHMSIQNENKWTSGEFQSGAAVIPEYIRVTAEGKHVHDVIYMDDPISVEIAYENRVSQILDITIDLVDEMGNHVFHVGTMCSPHGELAPGKYITSCQIPGHLLNSQGYYINLIFGKNQRFVLYKQDSVVSFVVEKIMAAESSNSTKLPGILHPLLNWETHPIMAHA